MDEKVKTQNLSEVAALILSIGASAQGQVTVGMMEQSWELALHYAQGTIPAPPGLPVAKALDDLVEQWHRVGDVMVKRTKETAS